MKRVTLLFGLGLLLGVMAGCGGSSSSTTTPPPPPTSQLPAGTELLYVGDNAGVIHGFGIDPSSGGFTTLPTAAVTAQAAAAADVGLVADAGSMVLYATSAGVGGTNVASFAVDQKTGALSSLSGQTLSVPPRKLAAYGNSLYVIPDPSATAASLFIFHIDVNGVLSLLANQPVTLPGVPQDLAIDPTGSWLFITYEGASGGEIAILSIAGGATGGVTASVSTGGDSPQGVRVTPDGKFVIVVNQATSNVSVLSLDASTGTLAAVSGSPFAGGNQSGPVAIDPGGNFVFVGDTGGNSLSAFTIGAAGDLAPVAGTPIQLGANAQPVSIAVDPANKFVYISIATQEISGFTLDQSTGALAAISGFPSSVGQETSDLVIMPQPAQ
jgi:6-phosphogluconolactonase (cycloisomerase 2 family)